MAAPPLAPWAIKVLEPDCPEPTLQVKFRDRQIPLRTVLAQVEVKVVGCLVEVEQTLTFQSQETERCSGELAIPLPERAAVCGFAVGDTPETLIEAQIVERKAARVAFETAVREQRPAAALLEKTEASDYAGRLYKTRVYPIGPQSNKVVRLTYADALQPRPQPASAKCHWALPWLNGLELLSAAAANRELSLAVASATLRLALPFPSAERCTLRVHVAGSAVPLPGGLPLRFADGAAGFEAKALRGTLALAVPELLGGRAQVWVERDGTSAFWLAYDSPAPLPPPATVREIRHFAVAWDASMSREGSPDLALLRGVLQGLPAASLVSCLCFDVDTEWLQVAAADREAVLAALAARPFDGGTCFAGLKFTCPSGPPVDAWLVFTDGLCSLGEHAPCPAGAAPIFVATKSVSASGLCELAAASGGCVFNSGSATAELILWRMGEAVFGFQGLGEQRGVRDVYPDRPTRTEPGERLLLVGRLREGVTTVSVRYGFPGEAPTSTRWLRVDAVEAAAAGTGGVIGRLWAQRRIAALEGRASGAAECLALARKHGVVTRGASLLVLTTLEEYEEHGLVPAQPDLRTEYLAQQKQKEKEEAEREQNKLQTVGDMWANRTQWWAQDRQAELRELAKETVDTWKSVQARHRQAFADAAPTGSLSEAAVLQALTALELPRADGQLMEEDARKLLAGRAPISSSDDFVRLAAQLGALGALRRLGGEGLHALAESRAPWLLAAGKPQFSSYLPLVLQAHRGPAVPKPPRTEQQAVEFSSGAVVALRRAFERADTDHNGRINSQELRALVASLRLPEGGELEEADVQCVNRRLCFEDFLRLMRQRLRPANESSWQMEQCKLIFFDQEVESEMRSCMASDVFSCRGPASLACAAAPAAFVAATYSRCAASEEGEDEEEDCEAAITLQPWDPQTPYLARMKAARPGGVSAAYTAYLLERAEYGKAPSFFLDAAAFLFNEAKTATDEEEGSTFRRLAARVLSSVCELGVEDPQLLRLAAYGLEAGGRLNLAEQLFRDVLRLRPEEPQSHRDLANLLARRWKARYFPEGDLEACSDEGASTYGDEEARRDARQSFNLWQAVLKGNWDSRFDEIELVCLMEMSGALKFAHTAEPLRPVAAEVEEELVRLGHPEFGRVLPCAVRISMAWDTDETDIDLHVTEPTGEEAYYGNHNTRLGGLVSRDFRQGYGPEEYVLREGMSGSYTVSAKFFASHRQDLAGATTILLSFFTDFGVPGRERRGLLTLRLDTNKESVHVGTVQLTSPTWESLKRNAEATVYAEAALEQWRVHAESAVVCLKRWWLTQRLLQPLELQPEPKTRRDRFRVLEQLRKWGCVEGGTIDREQLLQLLRERGMKDGLEVLEAQDAGSGPVDYETFMRWLSACKDRGAAEPVRQSI